MTKILNQKKNKISKYMKKNINNRINKTIYKNQQIQIKKQEYSMR